MALTAKMIRFAEEYIVDLNAGAAAIRAGYSENTAYSIGHENLRKPEIAELIQQLMDERSKRTEITVDNVLKRWWDIASADPNELIQFRRLCCRNCFGIDHKYQWKDEEEYTRAIEQALKDAKEDEEPVLPVNDGGYGFDSLLRPHPKCPKCRGEGRGDIKIADTRDLSPQAKALYAGVKTTVAGVEIKLHDQLKALDSVSRHLGMFKDKVEHSGEVSFTVNRKKVMGNGDSDD